MNKNKKGQVLSLDVIFSIVLIILMFFLLFNIVEARTYQIAKDIENKRLDNIGTTAVMQILNSSDNCYAEDSDHKYFIPGCLSINSSNITKYNLGIPHDYNCSFYFVSNPGHPMFASNECQDDFNNFNGVYFSYRMGLNLLSNHNDLNISLYKHSDNHMQNIRDEFEQNNLNDQKFILKVWKE